MTSLQIATSSTCQHDDCQGCAAPPHARVAVGRQPQAPPQLDRHQRGDRQPQPWLPLRRLLKHTRAAFKFMVVEVSRCKEGANAATAGRDECAEQLLVMFCDGLPHVRVSSGKSDQVR